MSAAVFTSGLFYAAPSQAAASDVKVQVNDDLVQFPDAQPFIDSNSRTQTPVRMVSEKLGYKVSYVVEDSDIRVTLKNDDKTIELTTGENTAVVNGESITIDTKAVEKQGRTYVPVSFIAKSFGHMVQWDSKNYIAIVSADGKYHAPAWYRPSISQSVIADAKEYLGIPYSYGGTSPSGFDCSGLVQYVFRREAVYLPRTANDMYTSAGSKVASLQAGDLVFFSSTKKAPATHVGIYLGNNQFISATTSGGVQIDSLSSSYWSARYFAAKRIAVD